MRSVLDRFLSYLPYAGKTVKDPALAHLLADELRALGLRDVREDANHYVYGWLPAAKGCENAPKLGFLAHTDTAADLPAGAVHPVLHENYDGGDVQLGDRTLTTADFPDLPGLRGRTLITGDGTTLLGSDDRAGVAEILTMLESVIEKDLPHGRLAVCFSADEEEGSPGMEGFDVAAFGCDYAFTVDGGEEGELEYENFNAAAADFTVRGFSVHPGSSKDTMINAALVAMEINSMLPAGDIPRYTQGYEGFYHLTDMSGDVDEAKLSYIVRDHDAAKFEARLETLSHITELVNQRWGEGTVTQTITRSYRNMAEKIRPCFHIVEKAQAAIRNAGCEPHISPIRGGTDGARLSWMGLPCPNLGTGGYAFHGPYEHCTAEGLEKAAEILVRLVGKFAE